MIGFRLCSAGGTFSIMFAVLLVYAHAPGNLCYSGKRSTKRLLGRIIAINMSIKKWCDNDRSVSLVQSVMPSVLVRVVSGHAARPSARHLAVPFACEVQQRVNDGD